MRGGLAYLLASLSLGWIAVWAGENLFWTTPAPDLRLVELLLTWGVYSVAAGAALSAVLWSGLGGWRAAFLGGALLGFAIEGAVVGTMYDAFPAQLVWTPLAWHGLISGLCVLGGGLALARGSVARQVAGLMALGVFGAVWGLYWPTEGKALAGWGGMAVYLGLCGVGVALGLGLLSRVGPAGPARWAVAGTRGAGGAVGAGDNGRAHAPAAGGAGDGGADALGDAAAGAAVGAGGGGHRLRPAAALGALCTVPAGAGADSGPRDPGLGNAGRAPYQHSGRAGFGGGQPGSVAVALVASAQDAIRRAAARLMRMWKGMTAAR